MREGRELIPRWIPPALFAALVVLYLWTLGVPSLWLDEAWEANYYAGFTAAPWYNRPVLYMAAVRGMVSAFGPSEWALRLLPCLAGLGAVALTYKLARRGLGRPGALFAAGLFALSPPFLRESHQLKNYAFDALFTVLLILLYARWRATRDPWRLAVYGGAAVVSFGFAFTSAFVVAALAAIEMVAERFSIRNLRGFLAAHGMIAAAFAANFLAFHRDGGKDPLLVAYFDGRYAPLADPSRLPAWLARSTAGIMTLQTGAASALAAVLLAIAGWIHARRHGASLVAWTLVAALAANAAASGLSLYPFGVERLSIFVAPLVAIVMTHGLALALPREGGASIGLLPAAALATALFASSAALQAGRLVRAPVREEIRDLVTRVASESVPGEALYVGEDAQSAFRFYWCRSGRSYPPEGLVTAARFREAPERHRPEVERLAAAGRPVWSLLTHMPRAESDAIVAVLSERFDHVGSTIVGDARLDQWRPRDRGVGLGP